MIHAASRPTDSRAPRLRESAFRPSSFRTLALLGLLVVALAPGCNTGSRNETGPPGLQPPPPDFPQLNDVDPAEGKPGDLITLTGRNFNPDPEGNIVKFSDNSGTVELRGFVESVTVGLFDPDTGAPSELIVRIPPGVRTGFIGLEVEQAGNLLPAGGFGFTGAPVILGYVIDDDGQGAAIRYDALGNVFPDNVVFIGYNLINNVTEVTASDSSPQTITAPSVFNGPGPNATYTVPLGLEAISVEIPPGLIPNDCQTDTIVFQASATGSSPFPMLTARVEVPFAQLQGPGNLSDVPGYVSGAITPSGFRGGDMEVNFNLLADPASARWDVLMEYQDPTDPNGTTYLPCTPSASSPTTGGGLLPGVIDQLSGNPGIIGPGQSYSYLWDTAADFPPGSGRIVTRLRLRVTNPSPASVVNNAACSGMWTTDWLVTNNDAPFSGSILEDFTSDDQEDPTSTANWNPNGTGIITSGPVVGVPNWGIGMDDIVLSAGSTYQLDTDFGTLFDLTEPLNPVDMLPSGNPGATAREFHVRSVVLEEGAIIDVLGDNPIVFRCSGDGTDDFLAAVIAGTLDLDGQDGTEGDNTSAGAGGAGGIGGGGAGGDGALIEIDPGNQVVTNITPAEDGELQGGGAGASVTFVALPGTSPSIPKAGTGGGGGHATAGEPGINTFNPDTNFIAPPGAAGRPYGDSAITRIRGGSGGGGGGGTPVRLSATNFQAKHGGGGGGGGGSFAVIARGSIQLTGAVTSDGGNGAKGSSGSQSGAGGGGAGGSILFRATGDVELGSDVVFSAKGGFGAVVVPSTTNQQRGGDGAEGRIRIEANGQIMAPGIGDFDGVMPPMGSAGISNGVAAGEIVVGTGIDGALDSFALGTTGTYIVDTDAGTISDDMGMVVFSKSVMNTEVAFQLSSLDIPVGVTLIGVGSNPLIFQVDGPVDVRGTIDVSGQPGGIPDYTTNPGTPTPGLGGAAGAGGGDGGTGADADLVMAALAEPGGMPPTMPAGLIDQGPPIGGGGGGGGGPLPGSLAVPASISLSVVDGSPAPGCLPSGSGGGGYATSGGSGSSQVGCYESGQGGTTYGSTFFLVQDPANPPNAIELLVGGGGGAGGASFTDGVSTPGVGAGGGGGGGMIQIAAGGQLKVWPTARFFALGGDAYAGPTATGNPGAGAGGAIRILGQSRVEIDTGSVFDVRGGIANVDPVAAGLNPGYAVSADPASNGGNGGSGRIRIATPLGFSDGSDLAIDPAFSGGQFATAGLNESVGISLGYPVSADGVTRIRPVTFQTPITEFLNPVPADAHVITLFQGAYADPANSARPGEWFGLTDDPVILEEVDYIRLQIFLYSSVTGAPEVDSIELPF